MDDSKDDNKHARAVKNQLNMELPLSSNFTDSKRGISAYAYDEDRQSYALSPGTNGSFAAVNGATTGGAIAGIAMADGAINGGNSGSTSGNYLSVNNLVGSSALPMAAGQSSIHGGNQQYNKDLPLQSIRESLREETSKTDAMPQSVITHSSVVLDS